MEAIFSTTRSPVLRHGAKPVSARIFSEDALVEERQQNSFKICYKIKAAVKNMQNLSPRRKSWERIPQH